MRTRGSRCSGCRPEPANSLSSGAWSYQVEASFLEDCIHSLQAGLEEKMEHLADETATQDDLLEIEHESLSIYQREKEILDELLHTPERKAHRLECILGNRLRRAYRQVLALARTVEDKGVYGDTYWRAEGERQIMAKILGDWWNWLEDEASDLQNQAAKGKTSL